MTFERVIWDIETDDLYWDSTTLWCLSIRDIDTGEAELFTDYDPVYRSIQEGVDILNAAELWANHNIIGFDIPVMEKLGHSLNCEGKTIVDTLITSRTLFPNIKEHEVSNPVEKDRRWSHSLEAWGLRLGEEKGDFHDWSQYSPEMAEYNLQDTATNRAIYLYLEKYAASVGVPWQFNELTSPLAIEHRFKTLTIQQELTGFYFDRGAAAELATQLMEECETIYNQLQVVFPPYEKVTHYVTPKRKEKKTRVDTIVFNPSSRKQIADRLIGKGWEPSKFTPTGLPVINEETISEAAAIVPEAEVLDRFFILNKLIGSILNGDKSWIRLERNGKIHGEVNTLGAVTTRVTHNNPNMSQVPTSSKPFGKECRALFGPRPSWTLVGADLSGIELRCLAHYLSHYDGGEYIDHVLNGDVHTVHQRAFGLPEGKKHRSIGKGGTSMAWGYGDIA